MNTSINHSGVKLVKMTPLRNYCRKMDTVSDDHLRDNKYCMGELEKVPLVLRAKHCSSAVNHCEKFYFDFFQTLKYDTYFTRDLKGIFN